MAVPCPRCGAWTRVLSTRASPEGPRRRYECGNLHRFSTVERVLDEPPPRGENPSVRSSTGNPQKGKLK